MASYTQTAATGDGGVNFNAGVLIGPTEIFITANPLGNGRFISEIPSGGGGQPTLQRWTHTGWIALGSNYYPDSNTTEPSVVWWTFLEFNSMDIPLLIPTGFVDSLYWSLTAGIAADITVFW
jgi:hypothetical protein